MSSRVYNRISNGSLVIAVISALFFERLGRWSWIAGLFGIAAAVAAVVTYFVNQSQVPDDQSCVEADLTLQNSETEAIEGAAKSSYVSSLVCESATYIDVQNLHGSFSFGKEVTYGTAIYIGSGSYMDINVAPNISDPFVDHVVEIVDRLCASENDLEFEVTREGNLLIRQAKRGLWRPVEEASETQTEPTLQFPETVH